MNQTQNKFPGKIFFLGSNLLILAAGIYAIVECFIEGYLVEGFLTFSVILYGIFGLFVLAKQNSTILQMQKIFCLLINVYVMIMYIILLVEFIKRIDEDLPGDDYAITPKYVSYCIIISAAEVAMLAISYF